MVLDSGLFIAILMAVRFPDYRVVCCVQFSADGRYVATGCNRTAQIFDVQTGQKVWYVLSIYSPNALAITVTCPLYIFVATSTLMPKFHNLVSLKMKPRRKLGTFTSEASDLVPTGSS